MSRLTKLVSAPLVILCFASLHGATPDRAAMADRAGAIDRAECTLEAGECFSYSRCSGDECLATTADQTCCCGPWGHDRRLR